MSQTAEKTITSEHDDDDAWTRSVCEFLRNRYFISVSSTTRDSVLALQIDSESRLSLFVDILFEACIYAWHAPSNGMYCLKIAKLLLSTRDPILATINDVLQLKCRKLLDRMHEIELDDDCLSSWSPPKYFHYNYHARIIELCDRHSTAQLLFVTRLVKEGLIDRVELVEECLDRWFSLLAKLRVVHMQPLTMCLDRYRYIELENASPEVLHILIAALAYLERADRPSNASVYIELVCKTDYISQTAKRTQLASTIPLAIEEARTRRVKDERRARCERRREWRLAKKRERDDMFRQQREERNKRRREQHETLVRQWRTEFDQWLDDNEQRMRRELRRQRAERRDAIKRQLFQLHTRSFVNAGHQPSADNHHADDSDRHYYRQQEEEEEIEEEDAPTVRPLSVQRYIRLTNFKQLCRMRTLIAQTDETLRMRLLKNSLEVDIENAYMDIVRLWRQDDAEADPDEEADEEADAPANMPMRWRETLAVERNIEWLAEKHLRNREDRSYVDEQYKQWLAEMTRYERIEGRQIRILSVKTPLPTDTYVWQLLLHKRRRLIRAKQLLNNTP